MDGLKFTFQKGGVLYARFNKLSEKTKKSILDILPFETVISHTRWCGREIYANIETKNRPPKENQTTTVGKFDMTYWRDWDLDSEDIAAQSGAISLFYGSELLRFHNGLLHVNVIGRVDIEQEQQLEEIGLRIWQEGFEKVTVEYHNFPEE
ncbi:MAG: DUF3830 family protein [Saccharofermentanales bacterium]